MKYRTVSLCRFSILLLVLSTLQSCADDESSFTTDSVHISLQANYLEIDNNMITFGNTAQNAITKVLAQGAGWKFCDVPDWVVFTPSAGLGNKEITISVEDNTSFIAARSATVYLTSEDELWNFRIPIYIEQSRGVAYANPSKSLVTFDPSASKERLTVTSNTSNWTVRATALWVKAEKSGNEILISVDENTGLDSREASVLLETEESRVIITVKQHGNSVRFPLERVEFTSAAGQTSVDIIAEGPWSLSTTASWLSVSPKSGSGNGTLTVSVTDNPDMTERTGVITVSYSGKLFYLDVVQAGYRFSVTDGSDSFSGTIRFSYTDTSKKVSVAADGSWTAESPDEWIILSPSSGNGDGNIMVSVLPNTLEENRRGSIVFSSRGNEIVVGVEQGYMNIVDGHEFVNLGLPSGLLWATCNIGAEEPHESGDFFAWGETKGYLQGKSTFSWGSYTYNNGSSEGYLTKYNPTSSNGYNGYTDNLTILEMADDAAHVKWGGQWRMPMDDEWDELVNATNCKWTLTTRNGVNGYLVSSSNGSELFFPFNGERKESSMILYNERGTYWSSCLYTEDSNGALMLYLDADTHSNNYYADRFYGFGVRPVYGAVKITGLTLEKEDLMMAKGSSYQLVTISTPSSANPTVSWTSSNPSVAMVKDGLVTAKDYGETIITATADGFSASCRVQVIESINGHTFVDLGLPSGLLWATCNVGASSPEDYGEYFAWGETTGSLHGKNDYRDSSYSWYNYSNSQITKYCNNSEYGYVDNLMTLKPEDDAAYMNWGGNWRMPSINEMQELQNATNLTWQYTRQNGVNGYLITSTNGNKLFLPLGGCYDGSQVKDVGEKASYWSSSLNSTYSTYANELYLTSDEYSANYRGTRFTGRSVRPVIRQ